MNVYLDNIKLSDQVAGGVSVYWCQLISRLLQSDNDVALIENRKYVQKNIFRRTIDVPIKNIIQEGYLPHKILRYLPVACSMPSGSIFHSSYYRLPINRKVFKIITVYDFIYEYYRPWLPKLIHHAQKRNALLNADGIICISENTKGDLLEFFPAVSKKPIVVIGLAASDEYYRIAQDDEHIGCDKELYPRRFILFVGDRSAYKNFNVAVEAVSLLQDVDLVIVGGGGFNTSEMQLLESRLHKRYLHYRQVDNRILNKLYNRAVCLLYPSSYEGFGIPLLEAMQAGCAVVSSNTSSIPEICGNAALLADTIDAREFAEKIMLLNNQNDREALRNAGYIRAKSFNWDKTYADTIEFYRRFV